MKVRLRESPVSTFGRQELLPFGGANLVRPKTVVVSGLDSIGRPRPARIVIRVRVRGVQFFGSGQQVSVPVLRILCINEYVVVHVGEMPCGILHSEQLLPDYCRDEVLTAKNLVH